MPYLATGKDDTGKIVVERTDTYREAVQISRDWHAATIDPLPENTAADDYQSEIPEAIRDTFPAAVADRIIQSGAYGPLAYHIRNAASECRVGPAQVLARLEDSDLWFAASEADDPAAFLASRVRDL